MGGRRISKFEYVSCGKSATKRAFRACRCSGDEILLTHLCCSTDGSREQFFRDRQCRSRCRGVGHDLVSFSVCHGLVWFRMWRNSLGISEVCRDDVLRQQKLICTALRVVKPPHWMSRTSYKVVVKGEAG